MSSQIRLRLLPRVRCLFDEPVQVKVAGLRSRQVVTTRARSTDEKGVVFSSSATYEADGSGEIDLERDPSLGGSYIGVEAMGLLWSMRADTLHKKFKKVNSLNPHVVNFSVHEGEGEGRMLAEATNERFLIGDGVSQIPVKEGNIHGVLFTPPGWYMSLSHFKNHSVKGKCWHHFILIIINKLEGGHYASASTPWVGRVAAISQWDTQTGSHARWAGHYFSISLQSK